MKILKVFIIDESPFFRRWFRRLIPALPGVKVIGEATDPLSAQKIISGINPDVVIMDLKSQWRFGIDLTTTIRRINPIPRVILLTGAVCDICRRGVPEKADYLLDKLTEYHKIPEILRRIVSVPKREGRGLHRLKSHDKAPSPSEPGPPRSL